MTETLENFEGSPVSDEAMIELLREKSFTDPETKQAYEDWYASHEAEADRIGTNIARIQCAVRRARVYYKAGYVSEATADLEETFDGAMNVDAPDSEREEVCTEIRTLLGRMKTGKTIE